MANLDSLIHFNFIPMHLSLLCPTLPVCMWWVGIMNYEGGLTPAACLWEGDCLIWGIVIYCHLIMFGTRIIDMKHALWEGYLELLLYICTIYFLVFPIEHRSR